MDKAKDGELYKRIELFGRVFEIYYGYYEEFEKQSANAEPIPIYPDFQKDPIYSDRGYPFATHMQSLCEDGNSRFADGCCIDCSYFSDGKYMIGICTHPKRRIDFNKQKKENEGDLYEKND